MERQRLNAIEALEISGNSVKCQKYSVDIPLWENCLDKVAILQKRMNGFELCEKILELDVNLKVCFMSSAEVNIDALREIYPKVNFGYFMKKPVTIEYLVKRLLAELD